MELANSIQEHGLIQPIIVRKRGEVYEVVAGERRWRAAQKAGLKTIPGIVREVNDRESLESALIENIQRENLNPLDEAEAFENLITEFNLTQEQISLRINKSRSLIANTLRLLSLPEEVKNSLRQNEISAGHARALLGLNKASLIICVWKEIISRKLSVRESERLVIRKNSNVSRETFSPQLKKRFLTGKFDELSEKLTQKLGTKVAIKGKKNRGKIEISFYSQEDLERIIEMLLIR
jgi:ParB family chromosome partitioning protein